MREADIPEFTAMLDAVCSLLSRGAYVPSPANTALFFRALGRYDLAEVRAAFDAHVSDPQRGRFVPVPADVIAQLDGLATHDGRPGADEAWAIALRAVDEADTVVWTDETAQAWAIARTVLDAGDEVGARVAYRDAYNRLVDEARAARRPAAWNASLGFDPDRRAAAIVEAKAAGRYAVVDALQLEAKGQPLLELANAASAPPEARAALLRLREQLTQPKPEAVSADAAARAHTADLQRHAAEQVRQHEEVQQP
jgi:hypothetical protein